MRYLCFRLLEMKMCDEQIRISSTGSSVWVSHNNNNNSSSPGHSHSHPGAGQERLVASYVTLYSQARLDTLDALDKLVELRQAEELKSKLLFSIIVVSPLPLYLTFTPNKYSSLPAFLPFHYQDPG